MAAAQKHVTAWSAALSLNGIDSVVNGRPRRLRLKPPRWTSLLVTRSGHFEDAADEQDPDRRGNAADEGYPDDEEIPLGGLSLRLSGSTLTLVAGSGSSERRYDVEMLDGDAAVELALALKVLRATTDDGAGIFDWHERGQDCLAKRPALE